LNSNYSPSMFITYFNAFSTSLLLGMMAKFFIDLGVSRKRSVLISIAVGISTPFWIYSRTFFSEPLASLGTLVAAWGVYRYGQTRKLHFLIISALCCSAIILIRPLAGASIPIIFLYLLVTLHSVSDKHGESVRSAHIGYFTAIVGAGICLVLLYNYLRFGSVMETGYDKLPSGRPRNFTLPPLIGLKILLFSPGKSIFLFQPLILPAIWGIIIWIKQRKHLPEIILTLSVPVIFLVILSQWARVEGGVTWGPRLFLPAIPVLLLGLAPVISGQKKHLRVLILAIIIGVCVQIPGILVNFSTYIHVHHNEYFNPMNGDYQFDFNPFPGHILILAKNIRYINNQFIPYSELDASHHRNLLQINYQEGLDLWFLHLWRDRVPISFILSAMFFQILLIISGVLLMHRNLSNAEQSLE